MTFGTAEVLTTKVLETYHTAYPGRYVRVGVKLWDRMHTAYYRLSLIYAVPDYDAQKAVSKSEAIRIGLSKCAMKCAREWAKKDTLYWNFDDPKKAFEECGRREEEYQRIRADC